MTVYVWHMLALAAFWGSFVLLVGHVHGDVDAGWWLQRPVWLVGPAVLAVPLLHLTGPARRSGRSTARRVPAGRSSEEPTSGAGARAR